MKRLLLTVLAVGVLAQPAQVSGQLYNGIPDATEYLNFLSGSGVNGGFGVQVGPYTGRFENPASAPFSLYCVDYLHYAQDGDVNVVGLGPVGNLSNTRLNNYGAYQQAAYLASLFETTDANTQWGSIHAAIWRLTSGLDVNPNVSGINDALRDQYLTLAAAQVGVFNTEGWYVLTPVNKSAASSGQEFLMRTSVSVPEPATFLLMASGLLMLAAVSRKRLTGLHEEDA